MPVSTSRMSGMRSEVCTVRCYGTGARVRRASPRSRRVPCSRERRPPWPSVQPPGTAKRGRLAKHGDRGPSPCRVQLRPDTECPPLRCGATGTRWGWRPAGGRTRRPGGLLEGSASGRPRTRGAAQVRGQPRSAGEPWRRLADRSRAVAWSTAQRIYGALTARFRRGAVDPCAERPVGRTVAPPGGQIVASPHRCTAQR